MTVWLAGGELPGSVDANAPSRPSLSLFLSPARLRLLVSLLLDGPRPGLNTAH